MPPIACSVESGRLRLIFQSGAEPHKHALWAFVCNVDVCAEMARLWVNWKVLHVSFFPVLTVLS